MLDPFDGTSVMKFRFPAWLSTLIDRDEPTGGAPAARAP